MYFIQLIHCDPHNTLEYWLHSR